MKSMKQYQIKQNILQQTILQQNILQILQIYQMVNFPTEPQFGPRTEPSIKSAESSLLFKKGSTVTLVLSQMK